MSILFKPSARFRRMNLKREVRPEIGNDVMA